MLDPKILKVSQLNLLIKDTLEQGFSGVLVTGEISNLVRPSSGHIYFSLKDESAQVRAVMFRRQNIVAKFAPQNGMHVIVTAHVSLYEARGDYQLIVQQMELAGEGALHARFLQLKAKLTAEGIFDVLHKKSLPQLPQCIGVITSSTGAVIRDILNVLRRRFSCVKVIIYPVLVQGAEAAWQITTALQQANLRRECEVLILARGGGSIEDLWPFNEEIVARAIFASSLPVVSAIGHETDFTIADFVADVRAPTPSAAAELVVPSQLEWCQALENLHQRLTYLVQNKLHYLRLSLTSLKNHLRHPRQYLAENIQLLDNMEHRLGLAMRHRISVYGQRLAKVCAALHAISPLATLARGYAIVSKNHRIICEVGAVNVGEQIQTKVMDGELTCLVQEITKDIDPFS